jgi:hypothetical protein
MHTLGDGNESERALSAEKLREEIASIRDERAATRIRLWLDAARAAAILLGAAILFWGIQRPDSVLSRAASRESIARERARLVLEWMKEPDASRRREALAVIRATYGAGEDEWVRRAEDVLTQHANADAISQALARIAVLTLREDSVLDELRCEVSGLGNSGFRGYGEVAHALQLQAEQLRTQLSTTKLELVRAGYDTTRLSLPHPANVRADTALLTPVSCRGTGAGSIR